MRVTDDAVARWPLHRTRPNDDRQASLPTWRLSIILASSVITDLRTRSNEQLQASCSNRSNLTSLRPPRDLLERRGESLAHLETLRTAAAADTLCRWCCCWRHVGCCQLCCIHQSPTPCDAPRHCRVPYEVIRSSVLLAIFISERYVVRSATESAFPSVYLSVCNARQLWVNRRLFAEFVDTSCLTMNMARLRKQRKYYSQPFLPRDAYT